MGARGPTGAAYSTTGTPGRVIERVSDATGRERRRERGGDSGAGKKEESEPLINILIRRASHVPRVLCL